MINNNIITLEIVRKRIFLIVNFHERGDKKLS